MDSRCPRKILHTSKDQEDELLCLNIVPEWPGSKSKENGRILTGLASGVVGIWNKGEYHGHHQRINICKAAAAASGKRVKRQKTLSGSAGAMASESVDCITLLPADFEPLVNNLDETQRRRQRGFFGRHVAVGTGDGRVKVVRTGGNPGVVGVYEHFGLSEKERDKIERRKRLENAGVAVDAEGDEEPREAILAVEVTCEGRLVSGGGGTVTMFFEAGDDAGSGGAAQGSADDSEDSESDHSDADGCDSDSSQEDKKKQKRKKRKKNKKANGRPPPKRNVLGSFVGLD